MAKIYWLCIWLLLCLQFGCNTKANLLDRPNVILILTDDQGIGDLACHGNPWIKTPNIDRLYEESIRLTDFHVSPLCTPSRAAIITGQYPINNGTWATYKGRDQLPKGSNSMARIFLENGYRTAMFGKWHLGDNYPSRPTDCGFELAVQHRAGGVGELSDYWGNSYFDDVYFVNNQPQQFEGYCTDIWFDEAMKFMAQTKDDPFFVYLPTNAPHDPLIVAESYAAPYRSLEGKQIVSADLYGMIANIDENVGRLERFLQEKGLAENTILIYMSDNGTRFGYRAVDELGFNMGFAGIKGDKREGGHRVPFFIRWPKGMPDSGKDIDVLAAHVDILQTLAGLCVIKLADSVPLDGLDLSGVLTKEAELADRCVFVHHRQDWRPPRDVQRSCIMKNKWRLLDGQRLYDVSGDRKQKHNLAADYPELVQTLLAENASFAARAKQNRTYYELPVSVVGNVAQLESFLGIQHAIGEDKGIWKCEQVAAGVKNTNNTHALLVEKAGWYEIECRRWPKECPGPLWGIPAKNPKRQFVYQKIRPEKLVIRIGNQILEQAVGGDDESVRLKVYLEEGYTLLENDFVEGEETYGVYYTYIRKLADETD
ncbi:MAG: arylsulfatase [Bacteroidota bacterium]